MTSPGSNPRYDSVCKENKTDQTNKSARLCVRVLCRRSAIAVRSSSSSRSTSPSAKYFVRRRCSIWCSMTLEWADFQPPCCAVLQGSPETSLLSQVAPGDCNSRGLSPHGCWRPGGNLGSGGVTLRSEKGPEILGARWCTYFLTPPQTIAMRPPANL